MTTTDDAPAAATPDPRIPSYEDAIAALRAIGAVHRVGLWRSRECTERIVEAVRRSKSWHDDVALQLFATLHERDDARRHVGMMARALKEAGVPRVATRPIRGGPMPDAERRALRDVVICADFLVSAAKRLFDEDPEALGEQLDALDRAQLRLWTVYAAGNAPAPTQEQPAPLEVHLPANPYVGVIKQAPIRAVATTMPDDERDAIQRVIERARDLVRAGDEFFPEHPEALGERMQALDKAQAKLTAIYDARPTEGLPLPAVEGLGDAPLVDDETLRAVEAPHVDVSLPITGGSVRLHSASGPLEALWVHLRDTDGHDVSLDRATGVHRPAAVRVTPDEAQAVSLLLARYAATHRETPT